LFRLLEIRLVSPKKKPTNNNIKKKESIENVFFIGHSRGQQLYTDTTTNKQQPKNEEKPNAVADVGATPAPCGSARSASHEAFKQPNSQQQQRTRPQTNKKTFFLNRLNC